MSRSRFLSAGEDGGDDAAADDKRADKIVNSNLFAKEDDAERSGDQRLERIEHGTEAGVHLGEAVVPQGMRCSCADGTHEEHGKHAGQRE